MDLKFLIVIGCLAVAVHCATVAPPTPSTAPPTQAANHTLRCRSCNRANSLDDCTRLAVCSDAEECFMDELITEQLTIVYDGGCRAKDVCKSSASGVQLGKRDDLVACSRCCSLGDDCNKRLCGIKSSNINAQQCYSCDHRNSDQAQVLKPEDCVTLTTCQSDEMCYAYQGNTGGVNQFYYGCQKKQFCEILMKVVFEDLDRCAGSNPDPILCGDGKRSLAHAMRSDVNLCHSCCGDGGCNYGECLKMNQRLWELHNKGVLDPKTLKSNSTMTGR